MIEGFIAVTCCGFCLISYSLPFVFHFFIFSFFIFHFSLFCFSFLLFFIFPFFHFSIFFHFFSFFIFSFFHFFVFHFFVLFCSVCFAVFCFALLCFALFCFVLFCSVLLCFALFCFVLFRSVVSSPPLPNGAGGARYSPGRDRARRTSRSVADANVCTLYFLARSCSLFYPLFPFSPLSLAFSAPHLPIHLLPLRLSLSFPFPLFLCFSRPFRPPSFL